MPLKDRKRLYAENDTAITANTAQNWFDRNVKSMVEVAASLGSVQPDLGGAAIPVPIVEAAGFRSGRGGHNRSARAMGPSRS